MPVKSTEERGEFIGHGTRLRPLPGMGSPLDKDAGKLALRFRGER